MKRNNLLLWVSVTTLFFVLVLGVWWLYLLSKLGNNLNKMIVWEGITFFILLVLSLSGFLVLYLRDSRKNKTMAAFFSSLTHELKTPLASIRLQTEVMAELLESIKDPKFQRISQRLIEDTQKLEIQMDKILQLSRMELGGNLNPTSIELDKFITRMFSTWASNLELNIKSDIEGCTVLADEFALELIFKNLIENTNRHSKTKKVDITIRKGSSEEIELIYNDFGSFQGDPKKLATLFYKHNSSKGSGIGLYLIKKLMKAMKGTFLIKDLPKIKFVLNFEKGDFSY